MLLLFSFRSSASFYGDKHFYFYCYFVRVLYAQFFLFCFSLFLSARIHTSTLSPRFVSLYHCECSCSTWYFGQVPIDWNEVDMGTWDSVYMYIVHIRTTTRTGTGTRTQSVCASALTVIVFTHSHYWLASVAIILYWVVYSRNVPRKTVNAVYLRQQESHWPYTTKFSFLFLHLSMLNPSRWIVDTSPTHRVCALCDIRGAYNELLISILTFIFTIQLKLWLYTITCSLTLPCEWPWLADGLWWWCTTKSTRIICRLRILKSIFFQFFN